MAKYTQADFDKWGDVLTRIADKYNEYRQLAEEKKFSGLKRLLPGQRDSWKIVQPGDSDKDVVVKWDNEENKNKLIGFTLTSKHLNTEFVSGAQTMNTTKSPGTWESQWESLTFYSDKNCWELYDRNLIGAAPCIISSDTPDGLEEFNESLTMIDWGIFQHYADIVEPELDRELEKLKS